MTYKGLLINNPHSLFGTLLCVICNDDTAIIFQHRQHKNNKRMTVEWRVVFQCTEGRRDWAPKTDAKRDFIDKQRNY